MLERFLDSRASWEKLKPKRTALIPTTRFEYEISEATLGHGLSDSKDMFAGLEFHTL